MNPAIDRKRTMIRSLPVLAIVTTLVLNSVWARDKTDVVIMMNGDALTCEIKELERARLRVSTDSMGTVQIECSVIKYWLAASPLSNELPSATPPGAGV